MSVKVTADFLENEEGELLLAFKALEGEPNDEITMVLTKNLDKAKILRAQNQEVLIDAIHPDIKDKLAVLKEIMVTETGQAGILHGYRAKVIIEE